MPDQLSETQEEPLTAFLQTQLTVSARDRFKAKARRQHLSPSALLRIMVMEMLEADEPAARS
jgi:hypothetical protein